MSCRRRDRTNLIGCNIGDVAIRGCSQGCCPYPNSQVRDTSFSEKHGFALVGSSKPSIRVTAKEIVNTGPQKFEHAHPHLLKGEFLTRTIHPEGAQPADIMPSGRMNLRFKSCESPFRPKFICLNPPCRRLFKPFFNPDRFEYRIDRYEWSFRPRPDVDPEVRAAKWMSGSRFSEETRQKIRELGERYYYFQQGRAVEPLSEEDIAWLKERDPEAWWTPLIRIGDDHQKRCPSCGGKGVRVGSNFRVPGRKDEKAWKELEKMVDEVVDMQAEFEFCPSVETWEEMTKEAERVKRKVEMTSEWEEERKRRIEQLASSAREGQG